MPSVFAQPPLLNSPPAWVFLSKPCAMGAEAVDGVPIKGMRKGRIPH